MAVCLEVLSPGMLTSVQDIGRHGFQEFGIPVCGTVSPHWMELGNKLVGNQPKTAGLEFRVLGPTLKAKGGALKLAICGDAQGEIISQSDAGPYVRKIASWRSFTLNDGDELRLSAPQTYASGFLAISGGFDLPCVMGSVSTYARSSLGGVEGRPLQVGDLLPINDTCESAAKQADKILPNPPQNATPTVRVVLGPQDDYFDKKTIETFLCEDYQISAQSDRMGARLDGAVLTHRSDKGREIVSDGVACGAIQVPGNGLPIVLLNDGQTVGGYPKIATVISCDLHLIANATAGTTIRFEAVNAHEACQIARTEHDNLQRLKNTIISASANGFVDIKALYEQNILSGMVDMANPDHFPGHL